MREFKFRARAGKVMVYFGLFDITANEYGITRNNPPNFSVDKDNKTIMQYTGLKDRNGKEIYEGDILCFPERSKVLHDMSKPNHHNWYGVVEYIETENKCGLDVPGLVFKWEYCEVIGNIYENPGLLK